VYVERLKKKISGGKGVSGKKSGKRIISSNQEEKKRGKKLKTGGRPYKLGQKPPFGRSTKN